MAIATSPQWGLTILRIAVGIVFLMHGGQKLFIYGLGGVTGAFGQMGVPMAGVLAPLVALIEFIGGAAVLLGVYARYAALLLAGVMFGAMTMVHLKNGFFLPQGYEYTLVLLAANLAIFVAGPGAAALVRRS